MSHIKTVKDLFESELFDVYNAEKQLTKALPKMAEKATNAQLAAGFEKHLTETEGQIARIERVFEILNIKPKSEKCEAMKGLIEEAKDLMSHAEEGPVLDAAMITAAQKVEHYEIATYGSLCALAKALGYNEAASILHETLEEERKTDEALTDLAEQGVNRDALRKAA